MVTITPVDASGDKLRNILHSAFLVRSIDNQGGHGAADRLLPVASRTRGWEQFRHFHLADFARECLIADGYSYHETRGLSIVDIVRSAMGFPSALSSLRHPAEVCGARGMAYHTQGTLAAITLDAFNKNLQSAYAETPSTWKGPMMQAASVPDFKNKHVIKFSAAGNLPIWQDNKAPQEVAFSNERETYAVEARALAASFSWMLYVNDDMDAISRVPAALGAAAVRTVDAVAWNQVTSNPILSDGQRLFLETPAGNRKRSNLTTGAGVPSNATVQLLTYKMSQMRGTNTVDGSEPDDILGITPHYLVAPSSLKTTVEQLTKSSADPAANGNSAVHNPAQTLEPVIVPRLDADSTTAWYLFSQSTPVGEVAFLAGQETPVINDYVDQATWTRHFQVVQSFAAKATEHRGGQKHAGQ